MLKITQLKLLSRESLLLFIIIMNCKKETFKNAKRRI